MPRTIAIARSLAAHTRTACGSGGVTSLTRQRRLDRRVRNRHPLFAACPRDHPRARHLARRRARAVSGLRRDRLQHHSITTCICRLLNRGACTLALQALGLWMILPHRVASENRWFMVHGSRSSLFSSLVSVRRRTPALSASSADLLGSGPFWLPLAVFSHVGGLTSCCVFVCTCTGYVVICCCSLSTPRSVLPPTVP